MDHLDCKAMNQYPLKNRKVTLTCVKCNEGEHAFVVGAGLTALNVVVTLKRLVKWYACILYDLVRHPRKNWREIVGVSVYYGLVYVLIRWLQR